MKSKYLTFKNKYVQSKKMTKFFNIANNAFETTENSVKVKIVEF